MGIIRSFSCSAAQSAIARNERQQAEKRPFKHKVVVRATNFRLPAYLQHLTSPPIQELYALLAKDEERNRLIVNDVIAAVQTKRSPVLLTERREHLALLADLLSPHVKNVIAMAEGLSRSRPFPPNSRASLSRPGVTWAKVLTMNDWIPCSWRCRFLGGEL